MPDFALAIVMIIAFNGFRDEEYLEPKNIFEKAGFKVVTASSQLGEATGKMGAKVKVDLTLDQVKAKDYAAAVFVGGPGSYDYYNNKTAHKIAVETLNNPKKILAAICAAPGILAHAGVLNGKQATVFPSEAALLKSKGAIYTGAAVETDGNLVTGDGPQSAKKFGEAVVKALHKFQISQKE